MFDHLSHLAEPSYEQLEVWRDGALRETERITPDEFAARLKVPLEHVRRFLEGDHPDLRLRRALSVYDFGPYPDLALLMAARFYESYDYETGALERWEPAVDFFAEGEWPGRVAGAAADIQRMLATPAQDAEVLQLLKAFGCRFAFDAISLTPRQWLQAVHDRLLYGASSRHGGEHGAPTRRE